MSRERVQVEAEFESRAAAARAVYELVDASFDPDRDIRVVVPSDGDEVQVPLVFRDRAVQLAFVVSGIGLVGGWLGGAVIASGLIPWMTMFAQGPVWGGMQAGYALGSIGFVIGALMGVGMVSVVPDFHGTPQHGPIRVVALSIAEHRERAIRAFGRADGHVVEATPMARAA